MNHELSFSCLPFGLMANLCIVYKQKLADFQEILLQEEKKQIDFLDEDYEVIVSFKLVIQ